MTDIRDNNLNFHQDLCVTVAAEHVVKRVKTAVETTITNFPLFLSHWPMHLSLSLQQYLCLVSLPPLLGRYAAEFENL